MSESASIAPAAPSVNDPVDTEGAPKKFTLLLDPGLWDGVKQSVRELSEQTHAEISIQAYIRGAIELRNNAVMGKKAA